MRFNMRKLAMITLAATMLMGCGKQTSEAADYDTQLAEYRSELNDIDDQIVELFKQRMAVVVDIARLKKENDQPVKNQGREDEVIARLTDGEDEDMTAYISELYTKIFELSRDYQEKLMAE